MHELVERANCSPADVKMVVPRLRDRAHILGGDSLTNVFEQTSFAEKIADRLTPAALSYIKALITAVSERYETVSDLRTAFGKNEKVLNPDDPDTPDDLEILKNIFFYEH